MSVSASEVEKMESRDKPKALARTRYTEEYRVEAVEYYRKAREIDPQKSLRGCARDLGVNYKTLSDWVKRFESTGRVTRARSDEQRALDEADRRIRELELENEFPKEAAAFFARNQA